MFLAAQLRSIFGLWRRRSNSSSPQPMAAGSCSSAQRMAICELAPPYLVIRPVISLMLDFFREPDNPHDERAIVVRTRSGAKIGYILRDDNAIFSRLMDAGKLLFGRVSAREMRGAWRAGRGR